MASIYVGNLNFRSTEEELTDFFSQYGQIHSVKIIRDRVTGRSRGFGFVEMDDNDIDNTIENLNGAEFAGRNLIVNFAKESDNKKDFRSSRPRD